MSHISCNKLKDTEWISKQDPYVCIEYGSNKSSTRTCKDGGKNPTFQEKFVYSLVEGLRDLNVTVWNSNTITHDDFIGCGKIPLAKALSQGFDDSSWPLQSKHGRHAGEVRLIMHYSNPNANKPSKGFAPPYILENALPPPMYSVPPPPTAPYPLQGGAYPPVPGGVYPPPSPLPSYPPSSGVYPPTPYPPQATPYHPPAYTSSSAYGSHSPWPDGF